MASQRTRQVVLEVDGDRWSATIASVQRRRFVVERCHGPEAGDEGSLNHEEILTWLNEQHLLESPLHLVVADKDVLRFEVAVPSMARKDLTKLIERQSRQKLGIEAGRPMLTGYRVAGKEGKRIRYSVLALLNERRGTPSVPMRLIASEDINLAAVCDLGEAAVFSMPGEIPAHLIIVDRNSQGIRFVAMTNGHASHERRISVPRSDTDEPGALAEDLSMELSRTLDYLEELGLPAPEAVAFSPSLGLDEDGLKRAGGHLKLVDIAASDQVVPEGSDHPGLSTLGYLRYLAQGTGLTVVNFSHRVRRNLTVPIAAAATLLVCLSGVIGGLAKQDLAADYEARLAQIQNQIQQEHDARERENMALLRVSSKELAKLKSVLSMRRPASLLFAEVSNRAPDGVQLTSLVYTDTDVLTIKGVARAPGRLQAIQLLSHFKTLIAELAYLSAFDDVVRYDTADDGTLILRFELQGRWSHES